MGVSRLGLTYALTSCALLASGCGKGQGEDAGFAGESSSSSGEASSTGESGTSSEGESSTGPLLDLGMETGTATTDEGSEMGCAKVDFLFVIDNSGSMTEEQMNLATSFPGFIDTIQDTLMAQDYHLMVTDTDAAAIGASSVGIVNGDVTCETDPICCVGICNGVGGVSISPPPNLCNGTPCTDFPLPTGCDATIGSGRDYDQNGDTCNIAGGNRYMLDSQPDLVDTFACAALVGPNGDGLERPMDAMVAAIGDESDAGGCNEGFLRDDAILVVTFITDEDEGGSMGDAAAWKDYLVQAKGGNEEAVVVLGLIADEGFPGGVCTDNGDAPILRAFAESFTFGQWGSVCEPDYAPFFAAAVAEIDGACDEFVPPG